MKLVRVAGMFGVAAVLALTATPAAALSLPDIDVGCPPGVTESKVAPTPQLPTRGVSGLLPTPQNPTTADPFVDGSDTSIYEAYGLAGLTWTAYDAGCGGTWIASPAAAMDTTLGNQTMRVPLIITAAAGALAGIVYEPTWLAVFDRPLTEISGGLLDAFWTPLAPFALAIAGIVLMWQARRSAFGTAAVTGLLIVAAIGVVAVATAIPARLGGFADTGITSTTGFINAHLSGRTDPAADPAVEAVAPFVDEVLYPRWLTGTLGDSDSTTATTYGPDLFRASAFTWAEAAQAAESPDRMAEMVDAKQQLWEDTAAAVKEADPDAYQHMTGFKENRFNEAAAAAIASGVLLFPIAAFLLMVAAYVLIRVVVMTAPVWATFAVLPTGHSILPGAAALVLAAVVNPVLASVGATLTLRTTSLLIAPDAPVPLWVGVLLSLLVCLIAWVALKPFRRVWALFTGNPLRNAAQEIRDDTRGIRGRVKKVTRSAVDEVKGTTPDDGQPEVAKAPVSERFVRADPVINMDIPGPVRTQPLAREAPPARRGGADAEAPAAPAPATDPTAATTPRQQGPQRKDPDEADSQVIYDYEADELRVEQTETTRNDNP